ncbi:hypothetical protein JL722_7034 [Aureococcus anophagefferens]|nr:hypothetical protein JL722_7034 [Aureococcus anophagefferens]
MPRCEVVSRSAAFLELELAGASAAGTLPGEMVAHACEFPYALLRNRRITSFFGGPVGADGAPVGSPPLRVHHLHVQDGADGVDFHVFETHGDFVDASGAWNTSWAPGTCVAYDGRPDFTNEYRDPAGSFVATAETDDVRAKVSEAGALAFSVRLRFAFATAPCAPVNQVWLHSPRQTMPWGTYKIPGDDTVSWWSTRMPLAGRLAGAHFHTHQRRFRAGYLVEGAVVDVIGRDTCGALEPVGTFCLGGKAALSARRPGRNSNRTVCRLRGASAEVGATASTAGRPRPATRATSSAGRYSFAAFHGSVWGDAAADVDMHDILWLSLEGQAARSVSVPLAATDINSCAADLGDEPPRGNPDAVLRGAEPGTRRYRAIG